MTTSTDHAGTVAARYSELIALKSTRHPEFDFVLGELVHAYARATVEQSLPSARHDRMAAIVAASASLKRGELEPFCAQHGICSSTLYHWKRKLSRQKNNTKETP